MLLSKALNCSLSNMKNQDKLTSRTCVMDKLQFGVRAWPAIYTLPHPLYPTPEIWKKSLNKSALASTKNQKGKKKILNSSHRVSRTPSPPPPPKKTIKRKKKKIRKRENPETRLGSRRHSTTSFRGRQCDQLLLRGDQIFTPGRQPGPQDRWLSSLGKRALTIIRYPSQN